MTRRWWRALVVSALVVSALVGCGSAPTPPPEEVTETWTSGDDAPLEDDPREDAPR